MYLQFPKQNFIKLLEVKTLFEYSLFYFLLICVTVTVNFTSFYIPYGVSKIITKIIS